MGLKQPITSTLAQACVGHSLHSLELNTDLHIPFIPPFACQKNPSSLERSEAREKWPQTWRAGPVGAV